MIILITGWFDEYDRYGFKTGKKLFQVSHGIDTETDKLVITSCDSPERIQGARFDKDYQEWVID